MDEHRAKLPTDDDDDVALSVGASNRNSGVALMGKIFLGLNSTFNDNRAKVVENLF